MTRSFKHASREDQANGRPENVLIVPPDADDLCLGLELPIVGEDVDETILRYKREQKNAKHRELPSAAVLRNQQDHFGRAAVPVQFLSFENNRGGGIPG